MEIDIEKLKKFIKPFYKEALKSWNGNIYPDGHAVGPKDGTYDTEWGYIDDKYVVKNLIMTNLYQMMTLYELLEECTDDEKIREFIDKPQTHYT